MDPSGTGKPTIPIEAAEEGHFNWHEKEDAEDQTFYFNYLE